MAGSAFCATRSSPRADPREGHPAAAPGRAISTRICRDADAAAGLVVLFIAVPQLVLVPLIQRRINAQTRERVRTLRHAGDLVVDSIRGSGEAGSSLKSEIGKAFETIYGVRLRVFKLKFGLKFLVSALQSVGVFALGGRRRAETMPPHPITVYASHPPSPTTAQHSLPGGALPPYRGRSFTGRIASASPDALELKVRIHSPPAVSLQTFGS
jgi:hypothetical protein